MPTAEVKQFLGYACVKCFRVSDHGERCFWCGEPIWAESIIATTDNCYSDRNETGQWWILKESLRP